MSTADEPELAALRGDWRGCYLITRNGVMWTARPFRDAAAVLTSDSPEGLRAAIRADYARWRPQSSSGP